MEGYAVLPEEAKMLLNYYNLKTAEHGGAQVAFYVDCVPRSVNSQYVSARRWKNGKTQQAFWLHPGIREFRRHVDVATLGIKWNPKGVTTIIIAVESNWVTKESTVRQADLDNKLKAIIDATKHSLKMPDELHWNIHAFKVSSKRTRTHVYVYDIGDVVDQF